jgi:adenylyltransferase/sulfurtransferase
MTITPREVKERAGAGENLRLIDVREEDEHRTACIEGAELIPMGSIPHALEKLRNYREPLVFFCHHGIRSLKVVSWLRKNGIRNCLSMDGGIDRWSLEIDRTVPRY